MESTFAQYFKIETYGSLNILNPYYLTLQILSFLKFSKGLRTFGLVISLFLTSFFPHSNTDISIQLINNKPFYIKKTDQSAQTLSRTREIIKHSLIQPSNSFYQLVKDNFDLDKSSYCSRDSLVIFYNQPSLLSINLLDISRFQLSYYFLRLNILASQAHPPTFS